MGSSVAEDNFVIGCLAFGDEMFLFSDNLSEALEKLKIVSTDSATDSVESCLDCLLKALANSGEFRYRYTLDVH